MGDNRNGKPRGSTAAYHEALTGILLCRWEIERKPGFGSAEAAMNVRETDRHSGSFVGQGAGFRSSTYALLNSGPLQFSVMNSGPPPDCASQEDVMVALEPRRWHFLNDCKTLPEGEE